MMPADDPTVANQRLTLALQNAQSLLTTKDNEIARLAHFEDEVLSLKAELARAASDRYRATRPATADAGCGTAQANLTSNWHADP